MVNECERWGVWKVGVVVSMGSVVDECGRWEYGSG